MLTDGLITLLMFCPAYRFQVSNLVAHPVTLQTEQSRGLRHSSNVCTSILGFPRRHRIRRGAAAWQRQPSVVFPKPEAAPPAPPTSASTTPQSFLVWASAASLLALTTTWVLLARSRRRSATSVRQSAHLAQAAQAAQRFPKRGGGSSVAPPSQHPPSQQAVDLSPTAARAGAAAAAAAAAADARMGTAKPTSVSKQMATGQPAIASAGSVTVLAQPQLDVTPSAAEGGPGRAQVAPAPSAGEAGALTAGVAADQTALLSLEELQLLATQLYILVQQMEMQLQDMVAELAPRLPPARLARLDELAERVDAVEQRLADLKAAPGGGAAPAVLAAEQAYAELQWQQFQTATEGVAEGERRAYRSLLLSLRMQRQLLRQVELQEALRMRRRQVEAAIQDLTGPLRQEQQQKQRQAQPRRGQQEQLPRGLQSGAVDAQAEGHSSGQSQSTTLGVSSITRGHAAAHAAPSGVEAAALQLAVADLCLLAAGVSIPHPAKAATGGEDAFLVCSRGLGAIAVADGVGGWAAEGVDPSLYPRRLMAACEEVRGQIFVAQQAQQGRHEQLQQELDPRWQLPPPTRGLFASLGDTEHAADGGASASAVLEAAYCSTQEPGSSTVILAVMTPGGRLSVANVGDCGLRVVRDGSLVYASEAMEHAWNTPLQLSSPEIYDSGSRPSDADCAELELQEGDLLVMGSDGLFDNLWDEQLVELAVREKTALGTRGGHALAERLAERLASLAYQQSQDHSFASPFAVERKLRAAAEAQLSVTGEGGKPDDITCVVALASSVGNS